VTDFGPGAGIRGHDQSEWAVTMGRNTHTAAIAFLKAMGEPQDNEVVTAENPLSLVHAAALWARWVSDLGRLHVGCCVIRPREPYDGVIDSL